MRGRTFPSRSYSAESRGKSVVVDKVEVARQLTEAIARNSVSNGRIVHQWVTLPIIID